MEPETTSADEKIRDAAANFRFILASIFEPSRAISIAMTHIDTAELWALSHAKEPA